MVDSKTILKILYFVVSVERANTKLENLSLAQQSLFVMSVWNFVWILSERKVK